MDGASYGLDVVLRSQRGVTCSRCVKLMWANELPIISTDKMAGNYHAYKVDQIPSVKNPDRSWIVPLCEASRSLLPWQIANVSYTFSTEAITNALADAGLDAEHVQVKSNYVGIALRELAADW